MVRRFLLCVVFASACGDDSTIVADDLGPGLDAAVDLLQAPDLPPPDLARVDLTAHDLPVPDFPVPDLPVPDLPVPDLPVPDLPTPDLPVPDLPTPDLAVPDQLVPDILTPDMPPPTGWVRTGGGTQSWDHAFGAAVAVDSKGNSYLATAISGVATFGGTTITGIGGLDTLITKLDSTGKMLWSTLAGGTKAVVPLRITVDSAGNSFVVGDYEGTATFGTTTFTSKGKYDIFLAKLDTAGKILWATSMGGTDSDYGKGIALDAKGNLYVAGYFAGTAAFGSLKLTSKGASDIFLTKLDATGKPLRATGAGGTLSDEAWGLAVDGQGKAVVVGSFSGSASLAGATHISAGSTDLLVAWFDSQGKLTGAASGGGAKNDEAVAVGLDSSGAATILGRFAGTGTLGTFKVTTSAQGSLVIARLDSKGVVKWVTPTSGTGGSLPKELVVDSLGNSLIAGSIGGSVTLGAYTLTSKYLSDPLLAALDNKGKVTWAVAVVCDIFGFGSSVARGPSGSAFMAGYHQDKATFAGTTMTTKASAAAYVWKRLP